MSAAYGEGADNEPTPFIVRPPKVGDLSASNTKAKTVKLTWSPELDADGYLIYYATSADGVYKKLAQIGSGKWTYTHKGRKKGTTCYYKVVSLKKNAAGVKAQSAAAKVKAKVKK